MQDEPSKTGASSEWKCPRCGRVLHVPVAMSRGADERDVPVWISAVRLKRRERHMACRRNRPTSGRSHPLSSGGSSRGTRISFSERAFPW